MRVHTDARAGESARAVGAHAYTVGRDLVFAPGRYAPVTSAGRHLLAHELADSSVTTKSRGDSKGAAPIKEPHPSGEENVMNRREQIKSEEHMRDMLQKIKNDPAVKAKGYCP